MSEENVEIVRRAHEAFRSGGIEAVRAFFTSDAVIGSYPEWAGPSEYRGQDGVRAVLSEWMENFDDFKLELSELHEVGDKVVMLGETVGRIKGSDVPIRQPLGTVYWDFRDGRIGRSQNFLTWREALAAASSVE